MMTFATKKCAGLLLAGMFGLSSLSAGAAELLSRETLVGKLYPVTGENFRAVDLAIPFRLGSSALAPGASEQLDALGAALSSATFAGLKIGVYGHTDASGPSDLNQKLSEARARTVADYLLSRFSIDRTLVDVKGYGESRLLPGVEPEAAVNRRVEIVVSRPAAPAGDKAAPARKGPVAIE